jgi:nucleotide-binding universal stress UspA family protein
MFTNVIVGIDGRQGGRDAMRLTHQLAAPAARITLVHVYGELDGARGDGTDDGSARDTGLAILERTRADSCPQADTICVRDPRPGKALHQIARERKADLMVVGSCHHGVVGRVLLGDDTRAALNGSPCALAIAPYQYTDATDGLRVIGVGYNATAESRRALVVAQRLAATSGAAVEALWVVSPEDVRRQAPVPADWPQESEALAAQAQEHLDQIHGITAHAVCGGPREELARLAHRADLLVVGSRGFGAVGSLFHGSVSSYLERHAESALLILTPELALDASPEREPASVPVPA